MNKTALFVLLFSCSVAHADQRPGVVIDTDLGLDDLVTLAAALQTPDLEIKAIVATNGVSGDMATTHLEQLLHRFNRENLARYRGPAGKGPSFRPFAEAAVARALEGSKKTASVRPFAPTAYQDAQVVLALGPLTNLAAAARAGALGKPRILVAGPPDPKRNWNLSFDEAAFHALVQSGAKLTFVDPGRRKKPRSWLKKPGQNTTHGEQIVSRLLSDPKVRKHYIEKLRLFDEVALLYYLMPTAFRETPSPFGIIARPLRSAPLFDRLSGLLTRGLSHKERVVFRDQPFPEKLFRQDLKQRAKQIRAKNGPDEWFAMLLANELHDHLGIYSVIGVKMGIHAGEILNAPLHAMRITSRIDAKPPVSCLNDGLLVATGSTPGRRLFRHEPTPAGSTAVRFSFNGRTLTLKIKESYRQQVKEGISALLKKHSLAEEAYWIGVRRLGLDVWESWHRRDLFETVE